MQDRAVRGARLAAIFGAAALVAAACGSGSAPGPAPSSPAATSPAGSGGSPGPPAGSRAQAAAVARRILSALVMPSGTRVTVPRPVPAALRRPAEQQGSTDLADLHEYLTAPQSRSVVAGFLRRHAPAGMTRSGSGYSAGPSGVSEEFVTDSLRHPPAGIYQADLVLAVISGARAGSVLRADAEVIWYPPRTRAEYVDPAGFRAVTVSVRRLNPRPRTIRRTFTARSVIVRLARSLDVLHADPGLDFGCPAELASYRITFRPVTAGRAVIVAAPTTCAVVAMSAGGRRQPDLLGSERVIALIGTLLGLHGTAAARSGQSHGS